MFEYYSSCQANSFSPLSIAGLVQWNDAQNPAGNGTQPGNGTPLSTWVDLSGQGNTYTQAVGADQPAYETNIINGKNTVQFDGSLTFMNGPSTGYPTGSQGRSSYLVIQPTNVTGNLGICAFGAVSASNIWGLFLNVSSIAIDIDGNSSRGNTVLVINTPYIIEVIYTAGTGIGSANCTVNGTTQTMQANATVPNTGTGNNYIGQNPSGGILYAGHIAEYLVYDSALSAGNATKVKNYLKAKYGL